MPFSTTPVEENGPPKATLVPARPPRGLWKRYAKLIKNRPWRSSKKGFALRPPNFSKMAISLRTSFKFYEPVLAREREARLHVWQLCVKRVPRPLEYVFSYINQAPRRPKHILLCINWLPERFRRIPEAVRKRPGPDLDTCHLWKYFFVIDFCNSKSAFKN